MNKWDKLKKRLKKLVAEYREELREAEKAGDKDRSHDRESKANAYLSVIFLMNSMEEEKQYEI